MTGRMTSPTPIRLNPPCDTCPCKRRCRAQALACGAYAHYASTGKRDREPVAPDRETFDLMNAEYPERATVGNSRKAA